VRARHEQLRPDHVKIYRDSTAQLEALKAGEFDLMQFFSAGDWNRRLNGKRIARG
jgi:microcin C transport system substrate-binding protein